MGTLTAWDNAVSCAVMSPTRKGVGGMKYDPRQTVQLLFAWRGTVWPTLLSRPLLWLCMITYTAGVIAKQGYHVDLPVIEEKVLHVTGGLLTFFVVFFTVECYQRFRFGFEKVKQTGGATRELMLELTSHFSDNTHLQREMLRLMVLAQHRAFEHVGGQQFQSMGQEDDTENFFSLENAVKIGLCTDKEKQILEDFISTNGTAEQYVLPLRWAHNLVNKHQGGASALTMQTISELIFTCRSGLSSLIGTTEAQIPLSFFHLLNFTMNVYCTLFAYSLCFVATWFCWITVIMYVVAMLGLREVSIMLAEPFGDDDSDISLQKMLVGGFKVCARILNTPGPESDHMQIESSWEKALESVKLDAAKMKRPAEIAAAATYDKMGDPVPPKEETDSLLQGAAGGPTSSVHGPGIGYGTGMTREDFQYV